MFGKLRKLLRPLDPPGPIVDPTLGTTSFDAEESLWVARLEGDEGDLRISIAGDGMPDVRLLERARVVAADRLAFHRRMRSFLEREAANVWGHEVEVHSLRPQSLDLFWPERPDAGMVYFAGGAQGRVWRCDWIDGEPTGFGFDD